MKDESRLVDRQVQDESPNVPRVTVVMSTYNRPGALIHAVNSVVAQNETNWRLIVVGDHCDEETGAVVRQFDDPRINYVNLPARCGEQSGPNSVGLMLARSEFVAFLNHDDVWFQDHLTIGIQALEAGHADFFIGCAAFAGRCELEPSRLMFTEASPSERRFRHAFYLEAFCFEPCSSWILRHEAAKKVGNWRASTDLYRTPLEDWVLRAWRTGLKLVSATSITVIKPRLLSSTPVGEPAYDHTPDDYLAWLAELETDPTLFRTQIKDDIARAGEAGLSRGYKRDRNSDHEPTRRLARGLNRWSAWLFYWTGLDWHDHILQRLKQERGGTLRYALRRRTGEQLAPRPDLEMLVADARLQLQQHEDDSTRAYS